MSFTPIGEPERYWVRLHGSSQRPYFRVDVCAATEGVEYRAYEGDDFAQALLVARREADANLVEIRNSFLGESAMLDAPECQHPRSEVRWRVNSAGRRYHIRQCLDCAASVGPPVANASVEGDAPAFDEEALERSREARARFYAEQREARDRAWWDWYSAYLQTDTWRAKRAQALKRDNGVCQGCLQRQATQVHHLTYAHVGNELLFELIAICDECHERAHEKERRS